MNTKSWWYNVLSDDKGLRTMSAYERKQNSILSQLVQHQRHWMTAGQDPPMVHLYVCVCARSNTHTNTCAKVHKHTHAHTWPHIIFTPRPPPPPCTATGLPRVWGAGSPSAPRLAVWKCSHQGINTLRFMMREGGGGMKRKDWGRGKKREREVGRWRVWRAEGNSCLLYECRHACTLFIL